MKNRIEITRKNFNLDYNSYTWHRDNTITFFCEFDNLDQIEMIENTPGVNDVDVEAGTYNDDGTAASYDVFIEVQPETFKGFNLETKEKSVEDKIVHAYLLYNWANAKSHYYLTLTFNKEKYPFAEERRRHYAKRAANLLRHVRSLYDNKLTLGEYQKLMRERATEMNQRAAKMYPRWFNRR